jgi:hypothetical protein
MREVENPADLLYLAALGEDVVGFGGFGRDRMFVAIEALKLAEPAASDRWAAFVPEHGVRKSSDPTDAAIVERAESRLRELGVQYFGDPSARREFQMIVSVVRGLQLVEDEEIGRWYSELIAPEKSAAADGEFAGLHVVPDPSLGRFVRLIAPPVQRYRGLRINTIEVFERAVAIRWHHIKPEPDYDGKRQWPSDESEALVSDLALDSELIDDVGTEYGPSTGETSWTRWEDGSIVGHGIEVRFPAPPPAAKRLTYRQGELELLIPIENDA